MITPNRSGILAFSGEVACVDRGAVARVGAKPGVGVFPSRRSCVSDELRCAGSPARTVTACLGVRV